MSFIINVSCKNTYLQNGLRFPILALVFFFFNVITFFHENIPLPFKPFLYLSIWWIPIYHSWASLQSLSLSSCFLSHSRHSCLRSLLWSHVIFLTDLLSYGFFHISLAVYKLSLPQIQSWKERKNHSMLISESWQFSSKPKQSRCSINICCLFKCLKLGSLEVEPEVEFLLQWFIVGDISGEAISKWGKDFPSGSVVKNPPANAGNAGLILGGRGRPPEKEMATHSSTLAWEIP